MAESFDEDSFDNPYEDSYDDPYDDSLDDPYEEDPYEEDPYDDQYEDQYDDQYDSFYGEAADSNFASPAPSAGAGQRNNPRNLRKKRAAWRAHFHEPAKDDVAMAFDSLYAGNDRFANGSRSSAGSAYGDDPAYADPAYGDQPEDATGAETTRGNPREAFASQYEEKARKHRRHRRILITCLVIVLVLILGAAGVAFAYLSNIQNNLRSGIDDEIFDVLEKSEPGEPFYMLLLGTDGSSDRESSEEFADGNFRTDSIMLLRIDPQNKQVTAISFHRDTMVDLGEYGMQKLNAAYAIGGASYAVEVVSDLASVPISHYAEVDFDGFKEIVDALGGIEVDVPVEIDDDEAGGHLMPGYQTLDGDQALILCRSRHTYDEYGDGDQFRAANQRSVIVAIAKKILSTDLASMISTIQALSKYVDTDMSLEEIYTLANDMRGMDMSTDFYSATNPTTSEYIDDVWWEVTEEPEWSRMMARVKQGLPPTEETEIDEATGIVLSSSGDGSVDTEDGKEAPVMRGETVIIRNGTDVDGLGASAEEILADMGFTTDTGNANDTDYEETVVVYGSPDQAEEAQEIADELGVGTIVQNDQEYLYDGDFLVVIGTDWLQAHDAPAESDETDG